MASGGALLRLEEVRGGYGPIDVLKGISLEVNEGEIVTIIGANGAGKTSTLLTISGLNRPRGGRIIFKGKEIHRLPAHEIVRLGVGHVPEGRKIFSRLTVAENLRIGAFTREDADGVRRDMERVYAHFPRLAERRSQAGGTLSGGEQQMLAIGRALMSRPALLLLDEPSLGLAPLIVVKIFDVIRELNRDEGVTVLLVEQNARMALRIASRGYAMETGRIVMSDASERLLADPKVKDAYLGE